MGPMCHLVLEDRDDSSVNSDGGLGGKALETLALDCLLSLKHLSAHFTGLEMEAKKG